LASKDNANKITTKKPVPLNPAFERPRIKAARPANRTEKLISP